MKTKLEASEIQCNILNETAKTQKKRPSNGRLSHKNDFDAYEKKFFKNC